MRGQRYVDRGSAIFYLQDDVYIIDGLQRTTAAIRMIQQGGKKPHLGAMIHFDTTQDWERERFRILNASRTKLSSNILVRNMRQDIPVVEVLYNLSYDKSFVLNGRVSWSQGMRRDELVTAVMYLKVVAALHSSFGPGKSQRMEEVARGLSTIMESVGRNTLRDNVKTFFELVDAAWGIRKVAYREGAVQLRMTFMWCLAMLLARHQTFWREKKLFVERDLIRKIAQFPINDPHVRDLASSSGKSRDILYQLLLDHVNSGKRTKRLVPMDNLEPLGESEFEPHSGE